MALYSITTWNIPNLVLDVED